MNQPIAQPKYVVCPQCAGEGKMVNRALSVWTQEDIEQDPESFENMRQGWYDVTCDMCQGLRVIDNERRQEFNQNRAEHFEMLGEMGLYPGHPDYF